MFLFNCSQNTEDYICPLPVNSTINIWLPSGEECCCAVFTTGSDPEASAAARMAADKAARRSPSSPSHKQQRAVDPAPLLQTRARPLYGNKGRQKWPHVTQEVNSVHNGVLGWYVWHVAATPSAAPNNEAKIPETMLTVCVCRHRIPVCVCSWHDGGHTQDRRQAAPQNQTPVQFPSSCVNVRSSIIFPKYGI